MLPIALLLAAASGGLRVAVSGYPEVYEAGARVFVISYRTPFPERWSGLRSGAFIGCFRGRG